MAVGDLSETLLENPIGFGVLLTSPTGVLCTLLSHCIPPVQSFQALSAQNVIRVGIPPTFSCSSSGPSAVTSSLPRIPPPPKCLPTPVSLPAPGSLLVPKIPSHDRISFHPFSISSHPQILSRPRISSSPGIPSSNGISFIKGSCRRIF